MTTRIMHVITGLGRGGAENVLYQLLRHQNRENISPMVVSLTSGGTVAHDIGQLGVPIVELDMRSWMNVISSVINLIRLMVRFKPDIIQTWMYHANLLGGVLGKLCTKSKIIWCLHHTNLDPLEDKKGTIRVAQLGKMVSGTVPDSIVCVSTKTQATHTAIGYTSEKMVVIPNGFDTQYFKEVVTEGRKLRQAYSIKEEIPVIGMAARYHPHKDFANLIKAAELLFEKLPETHFLLCGTDVTPENPDLRELLSSCLSKDHFHLLGERKDMPAVYSAMTIATLSSMSEAFPMTIGEAMSVGRPCVVTDVGDAAMIVADTGQVVPPRDPAQLCEAWLRLLQLAPSDLRKLGYEARQRIIENYSISKMVQEYSNLWSQFVS